MYVSTARVLILHALHFVLDFMKKMPLLRAVNVMRKTQLMPKALKFYNVAKTMTTLGRQTELDRSNLARRLDVAEKTLKSNDHIFRGVNSATRDFLLMQLQQDKERCGR